MSVRFQHTQALFVYFSLAPRSINVSIFYRFHVFSHLDFGLEQLHHQRHVEHHLVPRAALYESNVPFHSSGAHLRHLRAPRLPFANISPLLPLPSSQCFSLAFFGFRFRRPSGFSRPCASPGPQDVEQSILGHVQRVDDQPPYVDDLLGIGQHTGRLTPQYRHQVRVDDGDATNHVYAGLRGADESRLSEPRRLCQPDHGRRQ
jgi:hypothetical protein